MFFFVYSGDRTGVGTDLYDPPAAAWNITELSRTAAEICRRFEARAAAWATRCAEVYPGLYVSMKMNALLAVKPLHMLFPSVIIKSRLRSCDGPDCHIIFLCLSSPLA